MSESEPCDDASLKTQGTVKTGGVPYLQDQPKRDLFTDSVAVGVKAASLSTGFGMERENFVPNAKGNDKWLTP